MIQVIHTRAHHTRISVDWFRLDLWWPLVVQRRKTGTKKRRKEERRKGESQLKAIEGEEEEAIDEQLTQNPKTSLKSGLLVLCWILDW